MLTAAHVRTLARTVRSRVEFISPARKIRCENFQTHPWIYHVSFHLSHPNFLPNERTPPSSPPSLSAPSRRLHLLLPVSRCLPLSFPAIPFFDDAVADGDPSPASFHRRRRLLPLQASLAFADAEIPPSFSACVIFSFPCKLPLSSSRPHPCRLLPPFTPPVRSPSRPHPCRHLPPFTPPVPAPTRTHHCQPFPHRRHHLLSLHLLSPAIPCPPYSLCPLSVCPLSAFICQRHRDILKPIVWSSLPHRHPCCAKGSLLFDSFSFLLSFCW